MLDGTLRRFIDPPLDRLGLRLVRAGISANAMTLGGFAVGLLALPLLAAGVYGGALVAILINRLADGLDGAIARHRGASDLGGYLDIVCDFMFYGAVVFGFALAAPDNGLAAAFLLLAFIGTGGSFLAFAAMAARRKIETSSRGPKSLYYLGRPDGGHRDDRLLHRLLHLSRRLCATRLDLRRGLLGHDRNARAVGLANAGAGELTVAEAALRQAYASVRIANRTARAVTRRPKEAFHVQAHTPVDCP